MATSIKSNKKSIGFDQRNKARNMCFRSKTPHNRDETH